MNKIQKRITIMLLIIIFSIIIYLFRDDFINFIHSVFYSFNRTVIEEKRYILLLNGLIATLIISIVSIFFGTLLGAVVCYFQRKEIVIVSKFFKFYIRLMQGVPITVLLLMFYYIIFGQVNINPLMVCIITFSLYFSAYVAEIFKGALDSINISQVQSAYSLGFSKYQTLKYIVLPQALTYIIPVYKNEIVSLIKLTSIAGYISVMDLTKASDIIRNRTYEAFFPLILAAIMYFLICYMISKLLDYLYKKINPRAAIMKGKGEQNAKSI